MYIYTQYFLQCPQKCIWDKKRRCICITNRKTKRICDSVRISRNRCFIPNKNGKCLWFLSREPTAIPGSHLASDLWWQRIWSGTVRKKSWIQERDRIHWQYACIICIHTWNPNDSNDSSFVSEKDCWLTNWRGREITASAHIRLAFTTYSRPMLLAIWYLSSAASSASSLGNTTWQKNTATSNQHLLCWKMGLLGIQVVSLHTRRAPKTPRSSAAIPRRCETMKGIPFLYTTSRGCFLVCSLGSLGVLKHQP